MFILRKGKYPKKQYFTIFLIDQQRVVFSNVQSDTVSILAGVLQGSDNMITLNIDDLESIKAEGARIITVATRLVKTDLHKYPHTTMSMIVPKISICQDSE